MAVKHLPRTNYRVIATPNIWGRDADKSDAEELAKQIRRHCDDVVTAIESDAKDVCEHCGYKWTEDSKFYNGGCCDKDVKGEEDRITELGRPLTERLKKEPK